MLGDQATAPGSGVTIRLSPDGPHSPEYTRQVASAAAEAVRVLNHATLNHPGQALAFPADADAVIGSISTAAQRLPQLLDQLREWLTGELTAGRLQVSYGPHAGSPAAAVGTAGQRLRYASAIASRLHLALKDAAETTSKISAPPGTGHDDEEEDSR
jgi:hypothetical protein